MGAVMETEDRYMSGLQRDVYGKLLKGDNSWIPYYDLVGDNHEQSLKALNSNIVGTTKSEYLFYK